LKVVAGVLGIEFDDLYRRDRRRKRAKAVMVGTISIFATACLIGLALRLDDIRKSLQKITAVVKRMDETTHREFGKLTPERNSEWKQLVSKYDFDKEFEIIQQALQSEFISYTTYRENAIKFDESVTNLTPRFETFLASVCPDGGWKSAQKILAQCNAVSFQGESFFLSPNMAASNGKIRANWITATSISEPFLKYRQEAESLMLEMKNILKLRPVHPDSQQPFGYRPPFEKAVNQTEENWNTFVLELQNFPKTPEEKIIVDSEVQILERKFQEILEKLQTQHRKKNIDINELESLAFRETRWIKETPSSARYATMNISRLIFINDLNGPKPPSLDSKTMALAKRFAGLADWVFWGGAPGTESQR
jgi:hypothetical protein